jgi:outer membrane biogenesis lipoprotein LolB
LTARRRRRRALPLLALPLLFACGPRRAPALAPEAVSRQVEARQALYRGTLVRDGKRRGFRMALALAGPDHFRLELFGPVGGPRLVLTSDGTILAAALPGDRLFAEGEATPAAFGRLLGLPLGTEDLIALLTAEPGVLTGVRMLLDGRRLRYRLISEEAGRVRETALEIEAPGGEITALQVEYGAYQNSPWGPVPGQVDIRGPDRTLSLRLRNVAVRTVAPEAFRLVAPEGYDRVDLERLAVAGSGLLGGGA